MPNKRKSFVSKHRKQPLHFKRYTRKKSLLRNGTELLSFRDFMVESEHRCHNEDHRDGYRAGWEFHMGSGHKEENPHNEDTHPHCHNSWKQGFEQAGEDS